MFFFLNFSTTMSSLCHQTIRTETLFRRKVDNSVDDDDNDNDDESVALVLYDTITS